MFLSQMCRNLETGKRNTGVRSGVADILGRVDFWREKCIYFRSRLVGCDHLAGRLADNHQKSVFNPEQQKARDHCGFHREINTQKMKIHWGPLLSAKWTISPFEYTLVFPNFKAQLILFPLILVYTLWPGINHLIYLKSKEHTWIPCIMTMGQLEPLKKNFKYK